MSWTLDCVARVTEVLISTLASYIVCPLIKFVSCYVLCTLGAITLSALFKLRFEVYNEAFKYKRAECKNRLVLITGATSGIGLAAARHFYRRGFIVVACYYSKDEPGYIELNSLTTVQSTDQLCSMYLVELDVKSNKSIEKCYQQVKSIISDNKGLQLHALVNVAGVGYFHKFQWMPRDLIRNMVETNLLGPLMMTRQFLCLLIKCPGSRVVNVASPMALIPAEFNSVYGPTKAGLTQFGNSLEIELLRYGVATSTIHPGNLIRNTAVLDSSIKMKLDNILPELNDDERQLYKVELDRHLHNMHRVERLFNKPIDIQLSRKSTMSAFLIKLALIVSGAIQETRLDQNESFIRSFDNSVRLKHPPKEMYAGNSFYSLIIGSSLEWSSRALCRDIFLVLQRNRFPIVS